MGGAGGVGVGSGTCSENGALTGGALTGGALTSGASVSEPPNFPFTIFIVPFGVEGDGEIDLLGVNGTLCVKPDELPTCKTKKKRFTVSTPL
mgnify:CR=1 FL=1